MADLGAGQTQLEDLNDLSFLTKYVPRSVVRRLMASPSMAAGFRSAPHHGALMLADISGFTPLTERLSLDPEGAETLTHILDDYFGIMIECIHDHGGDVVKFCGDAVICVFGVDGDGEEGKRRKKGGKDARAARQSSLVQGSGPGGRLRRSDASPLRTNSNFAAAPIGTTMSGTMDSSGHGLPVPRESDESSGSSGGGDGVENAPLIAGGLAPLYDSEYSDYMTGSESDTGGDGDDDDDDDDDHSGSGSGAASSAIRRTTGSAMGDLVASELVAADTRRAMRMARRHPSGHAGQGSSMDRQAISRTNSAFSAVGSSADNNTEAGGSSSGNNKRRSRETLAECVKRAAQCAVALQHELEGFMTSDGDELFLHVTMACGSWLDLQVGGHAGKWEHLIAGEPLAQIGFVESHNEKGKCMMSQPCYDLIGDDVVGEPHPKEPTVHVFTGIRNPLEDTRPNRAPEHTAVIASPMRALIPPLLLLLYDAGQVAYLAEFRVVSVMFMRLLGLPERYDRTYTSLVHAALRVMQKMIGDLDGQILQFRRDEKGTQMIAAFGLPLSQHEDDAPRSVTAALDVKRALKQLCSLDCSIGITRGRAFCGSYGAEWRRDYSFMGNTVNLAARLMSRGLPGDILCDEQTRVTTGERFQYEEIGAVPIKGKSSTVNIYRAIGVNAEHGRGAGPGASVGSGPGFGGNMQLQEVMIGRTKERIVLVEQVKALRRGGPGACLVIEGAAGMGKSQLIGELWRLATKAGLAFVSGEADALNRSPLLVWKRVMLRMMGVSPYADPIETRDAVIRHLQWSFKLFQQAPLLNFLGLNLPDTPVTAAMGAAKRAEAARSLVVELMLAQTERQPTVIVLDSAHDMDADSWAMLNYVIERTTNALFVISLRPFDDPTKMPLEYDLIKQGRVGSVPMLEIDLRSMPVDAVTSLAAQRLGVSSLPPQVSELINAKAEGNPFYSEELALHLRDRELIIIEDGECRVAEGVDISTVELPGAVRDVVVSRIDQLSAAHQFTIKIASVIGLSFERDLLESVHPIPQDVENLPTILGDLCALDHIVLVSASPITYKFKHSLTRDAAYEFMGYVNKRTIHKEIIGWYERKFAGPDAMADDNNNGNNRSGSFDMGQARNPLPGLGSPAPRGETSADERLRPYFAILAYHSREAHQYAKAMYYCGLAAEDAAARWAHRTAIEFARKALDLLPLVVVAKDRSSKLAASGGGGGGGSIGSSSKSLSVIPPSPGVPSAPGGGGSARHGSRVRSMGPSSGSVVDLPPLVQGSEHQGSPDAGDGGSNGSSGLTHETPPGRGSGGAAQARPSRSLVTGKSRVSPGGSNPFPTKIAVALEAHWHYLCAVAHLELGNHPAAYATAIVALQLHGVKLPSVLTGVRQEKHRRHQRTPPNVAAANGTNGSNNGGSGGATGAGGGGIGGNGASSNSLQRSGSHAGDGAYANLHPAHPQGSSGSISLRFKALRHLVRQWLRRRRRGGDVAIIYASGDGASKLAGAAEFAADADVFDEDDGSDAWSDASSAHGGTSQDSSMVSLSDHGGSGSVAASPNVSATDLPRVAGTTSNGLLAAPTHHRKRAPGLRKSSVDMQHLQLGQGGQAPPPPLFRSRGSEQTSSSLRLHERRRSRLDVHSGGSSGSGGGGHDPSGGSGHGGSLGGGGSSGGLGTRIDDAIEEVEVEGDEDDADEMTVSSTRGARSHRRQQQQSSSHHQHRDSDGSKVVKPLKKKKKWYRRVRFRAPSTDEALEEIARLFSLVSRVAVSYENRALYNYANAAAMDYFDKLGSPPDVALSYAELASAFGVSRYHRLAVKFAQRGRTVAEEVVAMAPGPLQDHLPPRDLWGIVNSFAQLGRVATMRGEWDDCDFLFAEALAHAASLQDPRSVAAARFGRASSLILRGQIERSHGLLLRCEALADDFPDAQLATHSLLLQFNNALLLSDWRSADQRARLHGVVETRVATLCAQAARRLAGSRVSIRAVTVGTVAGADPAPHGEGSWLGFGFTRSTTIGSPAASRTSSSNLHALEHADTPSLSGAGASSVFLDASAFETGGGGVGGPMGSPVHRRSNVQLSGLDSPGPQQQQQPPAAMGNVSTSSVKGGGGGSIYAPYGLEIAWAYALLALSHARRGHAVPCEQLALLSTRALLSLHDPCLPPLAIHCFDAVTTALFYSLRYRTMQLGPKYWSALSLGKPFPSPQGDGGSQSVREATLLRYYHIVLRRASQVIEGPLRRLSGSHRVARSLLERCRGVLHRFNGRLRRARERLHDSVRHAAADGMFLHECHARGEWGDLISASGGGACAHVPPGMEQLARDAGKSKSRSTSSTGSSSSRPSPSKSAGANGGGGGGGVAAAPAAPGGGGRASAVPVSGSTAAGGAGGKGAASTNTGGASAGTGGSSDGGSSGLAPRGKRADRFRETRRSGDSGGGIVEGEDVMPLGTSSLVAASASAAPGPGTSARRAIGPGRVTGTKSINTLDGGMPLPDTPVLSVRHTSDGPQGVMPQHSVLDDADSTGHVRHISADGDVSSVQGSVDGSDTAGSVAGRSSDTNSQHHHRIRSQPNPSPVSTIAEENEEQNQGDDGESALIRTLPNGPPMRLHRGATDGEILSRSHRSESDHLDDVLNVGAPQRALRHDRSSIDEAADEGEDDVSVALAGLQPGHRVSRTQLLVSANDITRVGLDDEHLGPDAVDPAAITSSHNNSPMGLQRSGRGRKGSFNRCITTDNVMEVRTGASGAQDSLPPSIVVTGAHEDLDSGPGSGSGGAGGGGGGGGALFASRGETGRSVGSAGNGGGRGGGLGHGLGDNDRDLNRRVSIAPSMSVSFVGPGGSAKPTGAHVKSTPRRSALKTRLRGDTASALDVTRLASVRGRSAVGNSASTHVVAFAPSDQASFFDVTNDEPEVEDEETRKANAASWNPQIRTSRLMALRLNCMEFPPKTFPPYVQF